MHWIMREVELKSGEEAQVWKVTAPDPKWSETLLTFLVHKGQDWLEPLREALETGLEGLMMNFYECTLGEQVVGNITVLESLDRPVGLLQHVFTLPEHRRKGVASVLMEAIDQDFRVRGGRAMYLGTGYQSPPFWIYHSYGFRPICETGHMRWLVEDGFLERYFAPGPVSVRDTRWGDWPLMEALYATIEGWTLRSLHQRLYGQSNYEGPFVGLMAAVAKGRVKQSKVMVKEDGAIVGHAAVWAQREYPGEPWMLEFFVHPSFHDRTGELLASIFVAPGHKLQAVADSDAWDRHRALREMGMWREACLRRQVLWQGRWLDLHYYSSVWNPG